MAESFAHANVSLLLFYFYNWRIMALQCCVSALPQRESAVTTCWSLPLEPPSSSPPIPPGSSRRQAEVHVPCSSFTRGRVYLLALLSIRLPHSLLPLPMSTSPFSASCISIPALQIALSVLFFQIPYLCDLYICALIYSICFSQTSLCITDCI